MTTDRTMGFAAALVPHRRRWHRALAHHPGLVMSLMSGVQRPVFVACESCVLSTFYFQGLTDFLRSHCSWRLGKGGLPEYECSNSAISGILGGGYVFLNVFALASILNHQLLNGCVTLTCWYSITLTSAVCVAWGTDSLKSTSFPGCNFLRYCVFQHCMVYG